MTVLKKSLVVVVVMLLMLHPVHNSWVVGNEPLVIVDFSGFQGQKYK
jgi:hypothetical protein